MNRTAETVRVLFVVPDPDQPGLSPAERLGLRIRRDATVNGFCACGARQPPVRYVAGELVSIPMLHEADCPATSPVLERMVARLGDSLGWAYAVVEYEVAS